MALRAWSENGLPRESVCCGQGLGQVHSRIGEDGGLKLLQLSRQVQ